MSRNWTHVNCQLNCSHFITKWMIFYCLRMVHGMCHVKYCRKIIMNDEWVRIWKDVCHSLEVPRFTRNFTQDNRCPSRCRKWTACRRDIFMFVGVTETVCSHSNKSWCRWVLSFWNCDSAVGIAIAYGLDAGGVGVRDPVGSRIFSSPHRPDRLWAHQASYQMGTGGSFPGGKAARAWSWPLTSN
jgi:hypothetical protein